MISGAAEMWLAMQLLNNLKFCQVLRYMGICKRSVSLCENENVGFSEKQVQLR